MAFLFAEISFLIPLPGVWAPLGLVPFMAFAAIVCVPMFRWPTGAWPRVSAAALIFVATIVLSIPSGNRKNEQ